MAEIKVAIDALTDRRDVYLNAEDYYNGNESEVFSHARWRTLFGDAGSEYVLNYSKVVVDTVLDRLEIASVQAADEAATAALNKVWEQNQLTLDSNEIHRQGLTFGECYAIVWPGSDGEVQINYNSPKTTVMIYDDENPRVKSYAAKLWQTTNIFGKPLAKLNLYYSDRVEKYSREGELDLIVNDENGWRLTETVENPFGEVPVFHFRTHRPYGTPEHKYAMGPQNSINKLVATHMHTVDYQGAPQRYALSQGGGGTESADFKEGDTERENSRALETGPGKILFLEGFASVGEFKSADHKVFIESIQYYVESMASLTQTPIHHFNGITAMNSGEAFRNSEAPLTKKIADRQISFGDTWRELFRFVLKIEGIDVDVQIKWAGIESIDSSDLWNIAVIKKSVGVPLKRILMDMGYDEELAQEIHDENEKKQETQSDNTAQLGQGLNSHNIALKAQSED